MSSSEEYWGNFGPHVVEAHNDSSDFEEPRTPLKNKHNMTDDCDIYPTKISKQQDNIDMENLGPEIRKSFINPKLLPCLSTFFKRKTKKNKNYEKEVMKLYKKGSYTVRPLYTIADLQPVHVSRSRYTIDNIRTEDLMRKRRNKTYIHYSPYEGTSGSEIHLHKNRKHRLKKKLKAKMKMQHTQRENHLIKDDNGRKYHVYTSHHQHFDESSESSETDDSLEAPSGFWNYFLDKFHKKYQAHRLEMPRPCVCSSSQAVAPQYRSNMNVAPEQYGGCCRGQNPNTPQHSQGMTTCPGALSMCCQRQSPPTIGQLTQTPYQGHNKMPGNNSVQISSAVECKCGPKDKKKSKDNLPPINSPQPSPLSPPTPPIPPCTKNHDDVAAAIRTKYNGEILCIHNPPCILINGCLTLPPPKEAHVTSAWRVSEIMKDKYTDGGICEKDSKHSLFTNRKDTGCQYMKTCMDVAQFTLSTDEKKIQSICAHNPPCELVRGCARPRFDANMQIPCVHVPICDNLPICTIGKKAPLCEHRPKCPQIPVCSASESLLYTDRESIAVQANPQNSTVAN